MAEDDRRTIVLTTKEKYEMTLIASGKEVPIPVLPAKLKVTSPGGNETASVLELGDVLILQKKGLRTIAWDSFFPANPDPYVTGAFTRPMAIVETLQRARDTQTPIRLFLGGSPLDINVRMGIDSFDYEERGGEVGDIYYSIKLTEWKDYSPRKVVIKPNGEVYIQEAARDDDVWMSGTMDGMRSGTYTVREGDNLWSIAKRLYGTGDYAKIYKANQAVIGSNPGKLLEGAVLQIP